MNNDLIRIPLLFIAICAIQVFVLNHCQLFGCALPMLYLWFVLTMRKGMPRWLSLMLAFAMGLTLDMFSNTPGVTAAAMTAAAMAQPYLLELFISREGEESFIPSSETLGTRSFINYTIVLVTAFCVVYYTLEMLTLANGWKWLSCVLGSATVTVALLLAIDRLTHRK
jgi:rod shape-determining protein MreD